MMKRIAAALLGVLALGACGDDDDGDDDAPSESLLAEIEAGLCSGGQPSIAVGGTVFSLEDCP